MFFNNKYKKIISIFIVISFLTPFFLLIYPKKVDAGVDTIGGPFQVISTALDKIRLGFDKISSFAEWSMKNKELILDAIAWQVAKMAVRQMTTSIVNWINSGFDGNPSFVTDFNGMMTDIADGIIGEYIYGSELNFLCSPFSLQLKMSLYNTFYGKSDAYRCTLSDAVNNAGGALQSLENDFRWGTWIEMTNKQSNNIYGAFLEVEENILEKIATEQERKKLQADWGGGFLSWEDCEVVDGACEDGVCEQIKGPCTTKTPGSVIESQLNKNLDSGRESLITADEINEIIGALLMQVIQGTMSSTGLIGQKPSSYNNQENISSLQNEVNKTISGSIKTEREYNDIKNESLDLIMEAKNLIIQLVECLQETGEAFKLNLAQTFLNENTLIPQTNIQINLKSKEKTLHSEIIKSDEIILQLNKLIEKANNSTTSNKLTEVMNEYMLLTQKIHDIQDISDATIELQGYGTIVDGLPNGLTYNIDWLINVFAKPTTTGGKDSDIITYPPETEKGIAQRYNECLVCKENSDNCAYSGTVKFNTSSSNSNIDFDTP